MEITYKGIPIEFEYYEIIDGDMYFCINCEEVYIALQIVDKKWDFALRRRITDEERVTNPLFLWLHKVEMRGELEKEAKDFFRYLCKESPLRIKLLTEQGPEFYDVNK